VREAGVVIAGTKEEGKAVAGVYEIKWQSVERRVN